MNGFIIILVEALFCLLSLNSARGKTIVELFLFFLLKMLHFSAAISCYTCVTNDANLISVLNSHGFNLTMPQKSDCKDVPNTGGTDSTCPNTCATIMMENGGIPAWHEQFRH